MRLITKLCLLVYGYNRRYVEETHHSGNLITIFLLHVCAMPNTND